MSGQEAKDVFLQVVKINADMFNNFLNQEAETEANRIFYSDWDEQHIREQALDFFKHTLAQQLANKLKSRY